jgi:transcriptional regulator with XRE-family HTH domain
LRLTKDVVRAGRALLGWTQKELAIRTGLSVGTISRFEAAEWIEQDKLEMMAEVMREAGLVFVAQEGTSIGVQIPLPPRAAKKKTKEKEDAG